MACIVPCVINTFARQNGILQFFIVRKWKGEPRSSLQSSLQRRGQVKYSEFPARELFAMTFKWMNSAHEGSTTTYSISSERNLNICYLQGKNKIRKIMHLVISALVHGFPSSFPPPWASSEYTCWQQPSARIGGGAHNFCMPLHGHTILPMEVPLQLWKCDCDGMCENASRAHGWWPCTCTNGEAMILWRGVVEQQCGETEEWGMSGWGAE